MKKIDAMIFAAGLGRRMQHIGENTPKCLLNVGGKPLLWYIINRLKKAGVNRLVLNLHHQGGMIRDYLSAQNHFGLEIVYSYEPQILETGGGLKKAWPLFHNAESIVVHNSDIYTPFDLKQLINAHQSQETTALATLVVKNRASSRHFLINHQQHIIGHENQSTGQVRLINPSDSFHRKAFSGIHIISHRLGPYLMDTHQDHFSIIDVYLKALAAGEIIKAYDMGDDYFQDVGTPQRLRALKHGLEQHPAIDV